MLVLALDTSSPATSCALVELNSGAARTLAESLILPPVKAGDLLPDALVALCGKAARSIDEVSALAVGLGPGSFTGLRVGLASAKGLAYARQWLLAGASSLAALALHASRAIRVGAKAIDSATASLSGCLIPTLEARRGEMFLAVHSLDGAALAGDQSSERVLRAGEIAAFLHSLPAPSFLVGPGARQNRAALIAGGVSESSMQHADRELWPSAACLVELCANQLATARFDVAALFEIAPRYLSQSEPEKALAEGRVGKLPA